MYLPESNPFNFGYFLQVFDLKGSIRSRYVMSSEQNNVLLDENLLESELFSFYS